MSSHADQEYPEKGGIRWLLTNEERQHIIDLLGTEGM